MSSFTKGEKIKIDDTSIEPRFRNDFEYQLDIRQKTLFVIL